MNRFLRLALHAAPVAALLPLVACGFDAADSSGAFYEGGSDAAGPRSPSYSDAGAAPGEPIPPEQLGKLVENDWVATSTQPTSTFGIDVDTGSYTLMRRDLTAGHLPLPESVRPEEFINYFGYDYAPPTDGAPFAVHLDGAPSKFGTDLHLLRIGLQGQPIDPSQRKPANLIFLVDVSGSMSAENKLPLVKYTLTQLVGRLGPSDTLGIVTYAGYEKVLLAPTPVVQKDAIIAAIQQLSSSGSTNGEGGIKKAYALAEQVKVQQQQESINRVILCTDGDFNVGLTGQDLITLIEQEREKGITLTTLGYGTGNYQDGFMEQLADHGNGNYAYIDNAEEADRVLGKKLVATLQVIAKDAKIQIQLDPTFVQRYRLVGYENRVMRNEDFTNDKKDSGELGAGHSVTAFYEVELTPEAKAGQLAASDLATVLLRYKAPDGDVSKEIVQPFPASRLAPTFDAAANDFRFSAAVVEFAEILRRSKHSEGARFDEVSAIASGSTAGDADRLELVRLVQKAKSIHR